MILSKHKVHIFLEYRSVCPLVGIGTAPPLLPQASVYPPPPPNRGGGARSPAGEGVGESQFGRLEKKLSTLSTLCKQKYFSDRDNNVNTEKQDYGCPGQLQGWGTASQRWAN
jgi:hypothetical protein